MKIRCGNQKMNPGLIFVCPDRPAPEALAQDPGISLTNAEFSGSPCIEK